MSRKVLMLTAIVLAFCACNLQAAQIASTWVGGSYGRWGNPSNWSPAIVPDNNGNTFVVTMNVGAGEVDVDLEQDRTIDQLNCLGGTIRLETWPPGVWIKLTILDGLINHGDLQFSEIDIKGDVFNLPEGTMTFPRGTVDVWDGDLENEGFIRVVQYSTLWVEQTVQNAGHINVGQGTFGATDIFDNDGIISGPGMAYGKNLFDNKGEIHALGGSLVIACLGGPVLNSGLLRNEPVASLSIKPTAMSEPVPDVNNFGTIEVNAGGGVAFDCNMVNEPNAVIELLGGTLAAQTITQKAGAIFKGFGGITGDVVIDPNGIIKLTGPTNIVGDVEIGDGATLEVSDGLTLITGQVTCNGTIHMKGGYLIPQGGLSGDCNVIWEPGTYSHVADFNLDGQVNFEDFAFFADTWLWQTAWR